VSVEAAAGSGAAARDARPAGADAGGAEAGCPAGAEGKDTVATRSW
jgi:hypothetical protein